MLNVCGRQAFGPELHLVNCASQLVAGHIKGFAQDERVSSPSALVLI